jgi:flagellar hook-associated protein 3
MTISTSLLFDRSVQLMTKQQSDLASIQERVATGKELVRPSDSPELAVNIARIKSTIGQLDAYKNSLNSVNDRLRIEESYLEGSKDVLIKMKQLTLQGSNGSMTGRDREVIALEIDELTSEIQNLANGTDANGNFLFAGSRVATEPYAKDEDGIIRYQGDNYRSNIDYTSNRRSSIGRNGLDVFKPVLSGQFSDPIPAIYELTLGGTLEPGDSYNLQIDGQSLSYEVRPGDDVMPCSDDWRSASMKLTDQVNCKILRRKSLTGRFKSVLLTGSLERFHRIRRMDQWHR